MGIALNLIPVMENFDNYNIKNKIDIPTTFKTFIKQEYFQNYTSCNKSLLKGKTLRFAT